MRGRRPCSQRDDALLLQRRWRWLACASLSGLVCEVLVVTAGDVPTCWCTLWGGDCRAGGCQSRRLMVSLAATGYIEGEEIKQIWSGGYIAWSLAIAFFGAYVAFTTTMYMKQVMATRWYWIMLVQAGLALGVNTVWCMHFVGMQALTLQGGKTSFSKAPVAITFEPIFTIVSAMAAWIIATIALHIALGHGSMTASSTLSLQRMTMGKVRSCRDIGSLLKRMFRIIKKETPVKRISVAAFIVMSGVVIMHYMGMLSQSGNFRMTYNPIVISLSAVVAAVASWAGLAIFFILFDSLFYRAISAVIVSLAVNGMHYTGMQAASYYAAPFNGIWGHDTVTWDLPAMQVLIGVLLADFFLMAATGYYVEVLETVRRREGEAYEKELRHKQYIRDSRSLITRSRIMRFPMCVIRYDTFVRQGKLVSHEVMRDANRLVYINSAQAALKLRKKRFIVFFSHQWLSGKIPDPTHRQFQDMLAALSALAKTYRVRPENMYVWIDYSSIPQEGADQQQLAIDSITTYVSVSSAFVIVAPQVLHTETQTPCNFMTYSRRCWCRLEVFCSLLSTLRHKTKDRSLTIPEEGEEEEEAAAAADADTTASTMKRQHSPETTPKGGSTSGAQAGAGAGVNAYDSESGSERDSALAPPPEAVKARALARQPGSPAVPAPKAAAAPPKITGGAGLEQHRVFLVVDDALHRLNFFSSDGTLRKEYEELLFVFQGDLECCRRGHVREDGTEIICDKMKLVPSLCGCFGAMLEDLRRSHKRAKSAAAVDDSHRRALAERIVTLRHEIFPGDYFDTRIDAMQAEVERPVAKRNELDLNKDSDKEEKAGDEGDPEQGSSEDADESREETSSNTSSKTSDKATLLSNPERSIQEEDQLQSF